MRRAFLLARRRLVSSIPVLLIVIAGTFFLLEAAPGDARLEPEPTLLWLPEFKLVGMSRGETATLLGAPTEERDAAPAKIWKFMSGECVVDVYFYLDVARNDFYALHYNVQDRYGVTTGEPAERCLQRIYSESRR